jgi:16S rRNA (cytosine1402-N4)-methyltransferase
MSHIPVLPKEVLEYLDPQPNQNFIDATLGNGGHASMILERTAPNGKLLGIDQDPEQIKNCKLGSLRKRVICPCDNFSNLKKIVKENDFPLADGILFDLGMSSWHVDESGKGFSFQKKEPLDMRYSLQNQLNAEKIVNFWSKQDLERIFKDYGEEHFASQIAQEIIECRKFKTINNTLQLVEVIRRAVPASYQHQKTHFATRTFQALRIAVNDELASLEKALLQIPEVLKKDGRVVVISFHSLEERIVKNFFKANQNLFKILTKKPVEPSYEELKSNPRSRSAKLRAAQKI